MIIPSRQIYLAQINPVLGDLRGNAAQHLAARAAAMAQGADLVVFPEMSLTGYPPDDLALNPDFLRAAQQQAGQLVVGTAGGGPALLFGAPWQQAGEVLPRNAAWLADAGRLIGRVGKRHLPGYGEFYDARIFAPAQQAAPLHWRGLQLGIMICEDVWFADVSAQLAAAGAQMLLVLNASPYAKHKAAERLQNVLRARVGETGLPMLYVNMVGGHDELVFDGGSLALNPDGHLAARLPAWQEAGQLALWQQGRWLPGACAPAAGWEAETYAALVLAVRDYWRKNGFTQAVVGASGGIDSALVLAILVDALGPARVQPVRLPSQVTTELSSALAAEQAQLLGCAMIDLPIATAHNAAVQILAMHTDVGAGFTNDNLQSRLRGLLLMALTNARPGCLLASTGNKSELALGYCTLYGDTNGGFNPLKDLYKTEVYALANWRNAQRGAGFMGPLGQVVPPAIIARAPSAETRPEQSDEASLGYSYAVLDEILRAHIDDDAPRAEIIARVGDAAAVDHVLALVRGAQYKRQQACPGPKISRRAFGRSRQYPIINKFNPGDNGRS